MFSILEDLVLQNKKSYGTKQEYIKKVRSFLIDDYLLCEKINYYIKKEIKYE